MKALVRSHPSPPRKLGTSPTQRPTLSQAQRIENVLVVLIPGGCLGEAIVEALVRAGTQKSPSAAQLDAER